MLIQPLASPAEVLAVQVMPSGEVITRLVPLKLTAANKPSSGDQAMPHQPLVSTAEVLAVQVMPSGEVITRLVPGLLLTAANNPSSGDQAIPCQLLSAADVLGVQFI